MAKFKVIVRKKRSGFSLVEITVALGIIAFAFVSIFGLLPSGLTTFRRAMDISIGSQIIQRLINDAQQTDFENLKTLPTPQYFDGDGVKVEEGDRRIVYHATFWVTGGGNADGVSGGMEVLPQGGNNLYLKKVVVQVANNPGNRGIATDGGIWVDPKRSIVTSAILVAKQTK